MDSFSFYKSLYERELKRRHDLETGIGPILTVLSAIVAILYFFNKNSVFSLCEFRTSGPTTLLIITAGSFIYCLYNLCRAYNNFFSGFDYSNIPYPSELRQIEKKYDQVESEHKDYNEKQLKSSKRTFENELINKLLEISDVNKKINDDRGISFYKTRSSLITTFILTILQIIFLLIFKHI